MGRRLARARMEKHAVPPVPMTDEIPESEAQAAYQAVTAVPMTYPEAAPAQRYLTWNDLPRDARKCAKRPGIPEDAPVRQMRCINCRQAMWTRDSKKEDICETCEFLLIDEKHRLRGQHERARGGEFVNPFGDGDTGDRRQVNLMAGSNTRLL